MAKQRKEVFEYFDPTKAPGAAILIGATKVRRQNLAGPGQVQDVISIQPVYATDAESFKVFEEFEPNYRKSLAQKLKSAGYYRGPITGKSTRDLREAYLRAQSELGEENKQRLDAFGQEGQLDLDNIETFLSRQFRGEGEGGPKIPDPFTRERQSTKASIRKGATAAAEVLLGRGLSEEQFNEIYKKAIKREESMPVVTKYSKAKGGGIKDKTTGGADTEEFLYQEIAKTDEAKQNKIFGFYDAFKSAIGVK